MLKRDFIISAMAIFRLSPLTSLNAQETEDYFMWESFYVTPDNTKLKALGFL